jgi:hypothetical protein
MNRVALIMVVGASLVLTFLIPSSTWAIEGKAFKSTGTFEIEVPSLGMSINCQESGTGEVGVGAELKMTSCLANGKKCPVEPFVVHLDGSYKSSLFVTNADEECFLFTPIDWVPVAFKVESYVEEKGIAKVHLLGATSFKGKAASMSITSTWVF